MSVRSLAPEASVSANSTIRAMFGYHSKISALRQFTVLPLTHCVTCFFCVFPYVTVCIGDIDIYASDLVKEASFVYRLNCFRVW